MAKAELQEQLISTVLRTDRDGDFKIDEREANVLILRMKNYGGIEFDEEEVREALLKTDGSLRGFMEIVREIGDEAAQFDPEDDNDDETQALETTSSSRLVTINDRKFMNSILSNYSQQLTTSGSSIQSHYF